MPPRMTRAQRAQIGQNPVGVPFSLPAPISGWNTRDALDAMAPTYAVTLDNLFPDAGGVFVRNGYTSYATGMGAGAVKTLAEYNSGSTRKFLAAASGAIYDISLSGAVGAALRSGFTSDQWQTVNFLGKTFFANGSDTMQVFDGTSLADSTFTGVTLSTLIGGIQYQNRLFFWQVNSTKFWFSALNSTTGALSSFDLSAYSPRGGNLVAATTFSHDGGNGVLDFICFMTSGGDALVYSGNDPSSSTNWTLVGIYRISPPVNIRSVCNYGAESFVTVFDDHIPLQQELVALKLGQLPPRSKASGAVGIATVANPSAFGWQALYYPAGHRLIFNIPNVDGTFDQHICNTGIMLPGSDVMGVDRHPWCRFTGMNSQCWGLFNDKLYFGSAGGIVYQADTTNLDVLGAISATGQQAWNTFGDPSPKNITAIRPIVQSLGPINYQFGIGFDYGDINVPSAVATSNSGSPWDTSPWDTSPWSPEVQIDITWRAGAMNGQAVGVQMKFAAVQQVAWLRTDFRIEKGNAF